MSTVLELSEAEVSAVASALQREWSHASRLRAIAERRYDDTDGIDWQSSAANSERELAAIDSLVGKLPAWVAIFMNDMRRQR